MPRLPDGALLTRKQVAQISGFAEITLKVWASSGKGPKITRIEGRPRYTVGDVREWMGVDFDDVAREQPVGPDSRSAPVARLKLVPPVAAPEPAWDAVTTSDVIPFRSARRLALSLNTLRFSGVYFLCTGKKVFYVGQSVSILSRLDGHVTSYGSAITDVYLYLCPRDELNDVEGFYIRLLKPERNGNDGWISSLWSKTDHARNMREAARRKAEADWWGHIPAVLDFARSEPDDLRETESAYGAFA